MSNLTKEEYLKALDYIEEETTYVEDYETMPFITCNQLQKEIAILRQLINEHFDNPPLKWEELLTMIGEPVLDNHMEEWVIILGRHEKCEEVLCFSFRVGEVCFKNYKENRFYRKQVE